MIGFVSRIWCRVPRWSQRWSLCRVKSRGSSCGSWGWVRRNPGSCGFRTTTRAGHWHSSATTWTIGKMLQSATQVRHNKSRSPHFKVLSTAPDTNTQHVNHHRRVARESKVVANVANWVIPCVFNKGGRSNCRRLCDFGWFFFATTPLTMLNNFPSAIITVWIKCHEDFMHFVDALCPKSVYIMIWTLQSVHA